MSAAMEAVDSVSQKLPADIKTEAEEDVSSGHTCGVCGRSFPLLSSLSQHMRRHTREKPYKCPYCEHRTAQKGNLKAHVRSHKLGLLGHNPQIKEEEAGDKEPSGKTQSTVASDKTHNVIGKVKKKETKKKVKSKSSADVSGSYSCSVCAQVFPQVLLLKTHMKRHRSSQDHGCRICGRRFRQAWFLQSHMRIHRVKAQLRGGKADESPATINGVPQDPTELVNEDCLYELCAGCGNFFHDRTTLQSHEKLHRPKHVATQNHQKEKHEVTELQIDAKMHFIEGLRLTRVGTKDSSKAADEERPGERIPELDPVCSYQAWQLATRGRLVEPSEKCLGWQERLADAEVAYDTNKGEYVPLRQEKKRKQIDPSASNAKKKKTEAAGHEVTSNGPAHIKGGDRKSSPKDHILLNGLGHAFYEALHNKTTSPKQSRGLEQKDKKPFFCEHCDFHSVDASSLRSHLHTQHRDVPRPHSNNNNKHTNNTSIQSGAKTSRYMDYLRTRSVFLSQPHWHPHTRLPQESHVKTDKAKAEVKGQAPTSCGDGLLDLASPLAGGDDASRGVKSEGLVRHRCPFCSHSSTFPEVLWIHQRLAHRVDGSSAAAPRWAPSTNGGKSSKTGPWRRTGPPPFLEGKDCPALAGPRTRRTRAPGPPAPTQSKTQAGPTKSKHQSKEVHASDKKAGLPPHRKSGAQGGSKSSGAQPTSSSGTPHAKGFSKPRIPRASAEGTFPQEGLGFMLARGHGGTTSDADRLLPRRLSHDSSSSSPPDSLWAAVNVWGGLHGNKAYLEPLLFAQGKKESAGEDVLSLLKNYSPHDVAALYQHWGFVDPRMDPQEMLQLNGSFGNDVHSSSEASRQTNSRSTSSTSASLHKGT